MYLIVTYQKISGITSRFLRKFYCTESNVKFKIKFQKQTPKLRFQFYAEDICRSRSEVIVFIVFFHGLFVNTNHGFSVGDQTAPVEQFFRTFCVRRDDFYRLVLKGMSSMRGFQIWSCLPRISWVFSGSANGSRKQLFLLSTSFNSFFYVNLNRALEKVFCFSKFPKFKQSSHLNFNRINIKKSSEKSSIGYITFLFLEKASILIKNRRNVLNFRFESVG